MDSKYISQESLFELLELPYKRIWEEARQSNYGGYKREDLTQFTTRLGSKYPAKAKHGIIFYGRATNSWDDDVEKSLETVIEEYRCPFFNLMRHVSEDFYGDDWSSYVAWSNVSKIAPWKGGNPSEDLWNAQYFGMVKIIKKEIEFLSPHAVILVTGNTAGDQWHSPICEADALPWGEAIDQEQWGEDARTGRPCTVTVFKCEDILFLLTDRPEFRSIWDHTDCIIRMLRKHGAVNR